MLRTLNQNKTLHALLGSTKMMQHKKELVYQFSNERTTSSGELTYQECQSLIDFLKGQKTDNPADRMRKKIIALMKHDLKWTIKEIDEFCKTKGYLKKGFNDYTKQELPKLVSQFENIHKQKIAKRICSI
jgi:hypothetical protein